MFKYEVFQLNKPSIKQMKVKNCSRWQIYFVKTVTVAKNPSIGKIHFKKYNSTITLVLIVIIIQNKLHSQFCNDTLPIRT